MTSVIIYQGEGALDAAQRVHAARATAGKPSVLIDHLDGQQAPDGLPGHAVMALPSGWRYRDTNGREITLGTPDGELTVPCAADTVVALDTSQMRALREPAGHDQP